MDETTINTNTFMLLEGVAQVAGQAVCNSNARQACFYPTDKLKSNTTYTARLVSGQNGVKDVNANTLASNYEWTFTTGTTPVNPQVENVSPDDGETDVPINTIIQATFENDIDDNTLDNNSFTLENGGLVSGAVSYNATTKSAIFIPAANLASDSTYTARLTTAITDPQGLPLESDYTWSFTTGSAQSGGIRIVGVGSQAEDNNGDGLYDKLIVRVQVEVLTTGSYNLNGRLGDKNGEGIAWTSKTKSFSQEGIYFIDLEFNGTDIASHGVDGPFEVTNLDG